MTVNTTIRDHVEIAADEQKLALQSPKPGVDLSREQALKLRRDIYNDLETYARSSLSAAANIATFIDGHGAEAISESWRACPFAYLAGPIGMDPQSIRRLCKQGRALRCLLGRSGPNGPKYAGTVNSMCRMITAGRGDEIPKAWALADEIRSHDVIDQDGKKKNPPARVNARHVCAAVSQFIGPAKKRQVVEEPKPRKRRASQAFVIPEDHIDSKFQDPDLERQQVISCVIGHLAAAIDTVADRGDIPEIGTQKLREVKSLFSALGDLKTADNLVPVH